MPPVPYGMIYTVLIIEVKSIEVMLYRLLGNTHRFIKTQWNLLQSLWNHISVTDFIFTVVLVFGVFRFKCIDDIVDSWNSFVRQSVQFFRYSEKLRHTFHHLSSFINVNLLPRMLAAAWSWLKEQIYYLIWTIMFDTI